MDSWYSKRKVLAIALIAVMAGCGSKPQTTSAVSKPATRLDTVSQPPAPPVAEVDASEGILALAETQEPGKPESTMAVAETIQPIEPARPSSDLDTEDLAFKRTEPREWRPREEAQRSMQN